MDEIMMFRVTVESGSGELWTNTISNKTMEAWITMQWGFPNPTVEFAE